jgi:uncharacterized repeat protein (TIGR03803 family)
MSSGKPTIFLTVFLAAVVGFLAAATPVQAGTEKVLHNFDSNNNGAVTPQGGVIFDASGNLYGVTEAGGGGDTNGIVFELTPGTSGPWSAKIIQGFTSPKKGAGPDAPLVSDSAGNLYGTTLSGGPDDDGVVFQISRGTNGVWSEKVLHSFTGGTDGYYPLGPLALDAAGNVYGTTTFGGTHGGSCDTRGCGIAFELTPGANGTWTETILHSFQRTHTDGGYPNGVAIDAFGNLYGTTQLGGANSLGTVFQLTSSNGSWTENVIYNFCSKPNCTDGQLATSTPAFDVAGNLYGTTQIGGTNTSDCGGTACGVVFQLSPGAGGTWTENVVYSFCSVSKCTDGAVPGAQRLVFDAAGNLYGTTGQGGLMGTNCVGYGCGIIFELIPGTGGSWSETVLYSFTPNGAHGLGPSGVVLDSAGNLYGTTSFGGAHNNGLVFEVIP